LIEDPNAPVLWARFYEPSTGRAMFSDYDGKVKYDIRELTRDRLFGYRWYVRAGDVVLEEYPKWKKRIKP
jgi:PelA/Pel-15E family pectate lyase